MNKPEKWAAVLCVGLTMTTAGASAGEPGAAKGWADKAQRGELTQSALPSTGAAKQAPAVSGTVLHALEPGSTARQAAAQSAAGVSPADSEAPLEGLSTNTLGCGARNTDGNIRVNQDCDYRPQNETIIKIDPRDRNHVIGGFNDYRTGEGHAGFSFSLDRGRTWGDGTLPMTNRHNNPPPGHTIVGGAGTNHTYEASGDPGLAWDSRGNAFYSTGAFDRTTFASAVFATISPAGANGSFYFSIPNGSVNPRFVVAEDNNPAVLHDKPFIAADSNRASPFRDNLYLTWTVFDFSCTGGSQCKSPIYFSRSTDHATSWSKPKPISGNSPALCFFGNVFGNPQDKFNDCNFDQGADPIVLPDGTIVVVFNNGNTPDGNPNSQQLAVISHDAGNSWSGPVKVGDDVSVGEPVCADTAPAPCIPGADVRTNDFPRIGENRHNGHLYVVWQDYRTGEYDIHLSRSTDGGLTWRESNARVNPDSGRDHYFPAVDVANGDQGDKGDEGSRGDLVAVSYFRTDRVPNENVAHLFVVGDPGVGKGNTDYSLAGGHGAATPYAARQVSPETPPPSFRGFNGDYSGLAVTGREAHPLWSDARNNAPPQFGGPQQDEDIFTDIVIIPGE